MEKKKILIITGLLLDVAVFRWWDSLFWLRITNMIFIGITMIATWIFINELLIS